jgi:hypothetical protein
MPGDDRTMTTLLFALGTGRIRKDFLVFITTPGHRLGSSVLAAISGPMLRYP